MLLSIQQICRTSIIAILVLSAPAMSFAASEPATGSAGGVGSGEVLQVAVGLLLVVAAIVASGWFLRRFNGSGFAGSNGLKIIALLQLGQRERLVVVDVDGVQLLLGVSQNGIARLHELDKPLPGRVAGSHGGEFASRFSQALTRSKKT